MGLEKPNRQYITGGVTLSNTKTVSIPEIAGKDTVYICIDASVTLATYETIWLVKVADRVRCCYYSGSGVTVSNDVPVTFAEDGTITIDSGINQVFHTGVHYTYRAF